jgi:hypothetical protein
VQSAAKRVLVGPGEQDVGDPHAAPASVDGQEQVRPLGDEGGLQLGCDHEVAVPLLKRSQRGKDATANAEICRAHMRALYGALQAQGNASKIRSVHTRSPLVGRRLRPDLRSRFEA